jgi:hypothetical protein
MIEYKILVKDGSGNNLGEFETYRSLQFGKRLNNYGECTFEVPANDEKLTSLIALRVYTVWIYRNGDLFWAGEQATREGVLNERGGNWVTIHCFDWLEQLNSRYTVAEKEYTFTDAGLIAWDLINTTQADTNGNLGITKGTVDETTPRDRIYYNQNVMEAIISLANMTDGFDFEINTSKIFNVSSMIGIDRSDSIILEYGINMKTCRITEDFSKPSTRAIVLGTTSASSDQIRTETDDAGAQATYGLREFVYNEMEVCEPETLVSRGEAVNRQNNAPLIKIGFDLVRKTTPTIADFALGDIIRLIIKNGVYNIDDSFRVYEWQVVYNSDNTETLSLVLGNFILLGGS